MASERRTIEETQATVALLRVHLAESMLDPSQREVAIHELSDLTAELGDLWRARITYKVKTNDRWAMRALLALYRNQTDDERSAERTVYRNDIGFNGVDAGILTSLAKQLEERGTLSVKQMAILHKTLPKYAGQLARIATSVVTHGETE